MANNSNNLSNFSVITIDPRPSIDEHYEHCDALKKNTDCDSDSDCHFSNGVCIPINQVCSILNEDVVQRYPDVNIQQHNLHVRKPVRLLVQNLQKVKQFAQMLDVLMMVDKLHV